jgi:hypothetical protein
MIHLVLKLVHSIYVSKDTAPPPHPLMTANTRSSWSNTSRTQGILFLLGLQTDNTMGALYKEKLIGCFFSAGCKRNIEH